jgi:hypothetical protein
VEGGLQSKVKGLGEKKELHLGRFKVTFKEALNIDTWGVSEQKMTITEKMFCFTQYFVTGFP